MLWAGLSQTRTFAAASRPVFFAVIVNQTLWPARTRDLLTVFVRRRVVRMDFTRTVATPRLSAASRSPSSDCTTTAFSNGPAFAGVIATG